MFGTLPAYGFYCRHVEGLRFSNVSVRTTSADDRPALICDDVRNLKLTNFGGQPPQSESPLIRFNDVEHALVQGSLAAESTKVFLKLEGTSESIAVIGNDLSLAATAFQFESPSAPAVLFESSNRLP